MFYVKSSCQSQILAKQRFIYKLDSYLCYCFVVKWSRVEKGSVHVKNDMRDLSCTCGALINIVMGMDNMVNMVNMGTENWHDPSS